MIGKIFLLTACCCASLLSVSASEESQDTLSTTLHDEMKQVANYVKFLTNDENKESLEEKFKEVDMPSDCSRDALKALKDILVVLKEEIPFETSLFDNEVLRELEIQDQDQIFKSLLERVPLIKTMLTEFNAFLNDNPQRLLADKNGEVTKYYKKHISAKDANVKDYKTMVKFCNDFLDSKSPFMRLYKHLNEYDELVKKKPAQESSPAPSSAQRPAETQQTQDSAAPSTPAAPSPPQRPAETQQTQDSTAPGTPAAPSPQGPTAESPSQADHPTKPTQTPEGNLQGQQGTTKPAGSSFTYGGLTVATLCYFVLSAF
ncbi:merozoite surface antigen-2a2 (MSA-2a2) [Babesia bovis T2Bo]|uniref:Merozoite surface antigen 2a2 n=1 Tax=Babesia bovis TaxID=5865 RepID=Q3LUQ2_BABBO|nr:merozoite surface antigen-2a2 (MSA-2a2) [Babesia bovis T2Bo]ABA06451.1 merozoite surface antigen 2a2 [Babesia bovis]EDO05382.1 merozoite surface antigen-2a2 (MSA-2a2) [Babesia bovis T2Bo]|eukprot:XP_001608950.1 merozoite surface antigen-2a2 (MSA-2a2) [Babesia bovis T2Bo]